MVIHELSRTQCEQVIGRHHLGRLACARENQPYIVPISFSFAADERCLYSFSTEGQKIQWMRDNPKVSVAIDEIIDQFRWTTVIVIGWYEEISDPTATARQRAQELFQQRAQWWLPGAGKLISVEDHATPVFYRIRIDTLSGRRAGSQV